MTEYNLIEIVQMDFPDLGETLISHELRKAERDFVSKTYILSETFEDWGDAKSLANLEKEFYAMKDIIFYDAKKNVRDSDYEIDSDLIFHIGNSSSTNPLTASGSYYYLPNGDWGGHIPTNRPAIPEQFHEALTYNVLKRAAVRARDDRARIYFSEYTSAIKEGKQYSNEESKRTGLKFEMSMGLRSNK